MQFCLVPGGKFWRGEDEKELIGVKSAFWISKYPVTNAQFDAFTKDGGYKKAQYWEEAIKDNQWEKGIIKVWSGKRSAPRAYGKPFHFSNHPVVGVTWYEAVAFTRWLTDKWHDEKRLPENWQVQLPGNDQWEKAARGGVNILNRHVIASINDLCQKHKQMAKNKNVFIKNPTPKRDYPWGDTYDSNYANGKTTEISETNTVGCFTGGISPYGCEEMSGNVWEWVNDKYIRGGCFRDTEDAERCASRGRDVDPNYEYYYLGFRLLSSPFTSDL